MPSVNLALQQKMAVISLSQRVRKRTGVPVVRLIVCV